MSQYYEAMKWALYLLVNFLAIFCVTLSGEISPFEIMIFMGLGSIWISEASFFWNSRIAAFGPRSLAGVTGYILFFLTPLLDYFRNLHVRYLKTPDGIELTMSSYLIYILIGSICYKAILVFLPMKIGSLMNSREANLEVNDVSKSLSIILFIGLAIPTIMNYDIFLSFWSTERTRITNETSGYGLLVTLYCWYFVLTLITVVTSFAVKAKEKIAFFNIRVVFLLVLMGIILGWTGSRTTLLFFILIYMRLFTYLIRPMSSRDSLSLVLITIGTLFVGSLFKAEGIFGLINLVSGQWSLSYLSETYDRGILGLLRSDLSRVGVGSLLINNAETLDFQSLYGATYAASFFFFLSSLVGIGFGEISNFLPTVVGGGLLRGTTESYAELNDFSRAFGFPVEAYLNFGKIGVVLAFVVFAIIIYFLNSRHFYVLKYHDIKSALWSATLAPIPPMLMLFDSTVILSYFIRFIFPIIILTRIAKFKHPNLSLI
jgi:hypothetical protein